MVELDVFVIGGGTAGAYAAETARQNGASVGLAERDRVGGDCIFHACIPTKALIQAARAYKKSRNGDSFGLPSVPGQVEYSRVKSAKDKIVSDMAQGQEKDLTEKGISLYKGRASFASPHEVRVGSETIKANKVVVATGARPAIPPIPGLKEAGFITNIEALELELVPKRLAIIGGGPVGCEFAQIFSSFGAGVGIYETAPRLLINEDEEVSEVLPGFFSARGIEVFAGVTVTEVKLDGSAKMLVCRDREGKQRTDPYDTLLVATGRSPNVEELNLGAAGVAVGRKGIPVNEQMRTDVPHIWAAGDVTGTFLFTYIAWEQGEAAGWNATSDSPRSLDYSILPRVTFCDPEVASVGLTEAQAREKGLSPRVGKWEFSSLPRAMVSGETDGFIKIVADGKSGRILGGHIIGQEASTLVHQVAVAIRGGVGVADIGRMVHAYPTFSEGIRWACKEAG